MTVRYRSSAVSILSGNISFTAFSLSFELLVALSLNSRSFSAIPIFWGSFPRFARSVWSGSDKSFYSGLFWKVGSIFTSSVSGSSFISGLASLSSFTG